MRTRSVRQVLAALWLVVALIALLPALQAAPDATVLASGFSCREQIEALAGRPTLQLAEVLAGE